LHLGQMPQARAQAAQLFLRARAQDSHGLGQGCRALAQWASSQGQIERVNHYLRIADTSATKRGSPREAALNQLCRAELALSAGASPAAQAQARTYAAQAAEAFGAMGMPWYTARAEAVLVLG
jgi:hypothetical protein